MTRLKDFIRFLGSYGLSVVLLLTLLLLVFFGTLEQTRIGLYEAQQKYFESFFLVHRLFGHLPVPLPGGYLLLALVFVSMLIGAVIRAPKRLSRPGLLIAHTGILMLILAGFVGYHYSISGNMPLYEGDSGSSIRSYYDWEIQITEMDPADSGLRFIIPQEQFQDCTGERTAVFRHDSLPFQLETGPCYLNSVVEQGNGPAAVEGVILRAAEPAQSAEMNVPGIFVTLSGDASEKGLLWGMEKAPWLIQANGRNYTIALKRREWALPFILTLNAFTHEKHPGTELPSAFTSRLTLQDGDASRDVVIRMNEPLRHRGYTFYQASWGPANAQEGEPLYSVLAVTRNRAAQWPLYASCLISFGLILHYGQVLFRYLKRGRAGTHA